MQITLSEIRTLSSGASGGPQVGISILSSTGALSMVFISPLTDNHNGHEDCGVVRGTQDYKWNDYPCSFKLNYICEKDTT